MTTRRPTWSALLRWTTSSLAFVLVVVVVVPIWCRTGGGTRTGAATAAAAFSSLGLSVPSSPRSARSSTPPPHSVVGGRGRQQRFDATTGWWGPSLSSSVPRPHPPLRALARERRGGGGADHPAVQAQQRSETSDDPPVVITDDSSPSQQGDATPSQTSSTRTSSSVVEEEDTAVADIRVSATHRPNDLSTRVPVCEYHELSVPPGLLDNQGDGAATTEPQQLVSTRDLTPVLKQLVLQSGMQYGTVTVLSRHTTTSIVINEHERRLAMDVSAHLLTLAPIDERSAHPLRQVGTRYLHNDIELRPDSREEFQRCLDNGYDVRDPQVLDAWRAQEPINAHSHLLSMLLGSSESIPVVKGTMTIGQWQSVLLVDLDGPRTRTVGVNLLGYR